MIESEIFLTLVKYPAPKRPNQVIVSVFRDVIDKEFHRDQIEWLCPPLVKLPRISKEVTPSALLSPNLQKEKK